MIVCIIVVICVIIGAGSNRATASPTIRLDTVTFIISAGRINRTYRIYTALLFLHIYIQLMVIVVSLHLLVVIIT